MGWHWRDRCPQCGSVFLEHECSVEFRDRVAGLIEQRQRLIAQSRREDPGYYEREEADWRTQMRFEV